LNFLDIIFLIPVIWFAWRGFRHGLIIELATLAALILGVYAALYYSGHISGWIENSYTFNEGTAVILSYILTFLLVFVIVFVLGKILEKVIDIIALGVLNKLLGLIFGVFKAMVLISIAFILINRYDKNLISEENKNGSFLYKYIAPVCEIFLDSIENFTTGNSGQAESGDATSKFRECFN